MNFDSENRELNYDIAVIGAGPAGIGAAVAARRFGASVLLVERDGTVGGMGTSGLLNIWCGNANSFLLDRVQAVTTKTIRGRNLYWPESLKLAYLDELEKAGVDLLLHSLMTGVDNGKGGRISAVRLNGKSGELTVRAGTFIDATDDGDLAALCGVPFEKGRESDGLMQPMTLEFMLGGVDDERAIYGGATGSPVIRKKLDEYLADGRVSRPVGMIILIEGVEKSTVFCNMTNVIEVDGTDVFDLTRAEIAARRQIPQIVNFLRENVPGYENCFAAASGAYVGARETRRFHGLYTLTEDDILARRQFDDAIVYNASYLFGVHNPKGTLEKQNQPEYHGEAYTIPCRCFVPVGMNNLMLAGRCISGTHMAHSSYRVMPICMAMGEGVGTCAAVAQRDGTDVCRLSDGQLAEVQSFLKR